LANAKTPLFHHAVGRSLAERAQLADALYASGPEGLRRVAQLLAGWVG